MFREYSQCIKRIVHESSIEDSLCPEMMVSVQRGWFVSGEDDPCIELKSGTCIERKPCMERIVQAGPRTKIMIIYRDDMNG